jgi:hypothetical protein
MSPNPKSAIQNPKSFLLLFLALTLSAILLFSGCTDSTLARWQSARDTLKRDLIATTQQIPLLRTELELLPPGPARDKAAAALTAAEQLAPQLAARIDNLDQIITAARTGDASAVGSSLGGLLTGVPIIGPYAGLIGLLAGFGWGIFQRIKRAKEVDDALAAANETRDHLKNVVTSLEQAGPDWTDQDKAAIAALQGPATTAAVHEIKSV